MYAEEVNTSGMMAICSNKKILKTLKSVLGE